MTCGTVWVFWVCPGFGFRLLAGAVPGPLAECESFTHLIAEKIGFRWWRDSTGVVVVPPPPSPHLSHSILFVPPSLAMDTHGLKQSTWQRDLGVVTQPTTPVSRKSLSFHVQAAERRPGQHPLVESGSSLNSRHSSMERLQQPAGSPLSSLLWLPAYSGVYFTFFSYISLLWRR